jgi:hypothetical protein
MKKLKKLELQKHTENMLYAGLRHLEDLHLAHSHNPLDKILNADVPGTDITVGKLIYNAFKIIEPLVDIARQQYPAFFKFIDWAASIVKKLLKN